jgi:hypothetical protein
MYELKNRTILVSLKSGQIVDRSTLAGLKWVNRKDNMESKYARSAFGRRVL